MLQKSKRTQLTQQKRFFRFNSHIHSHTAAAHAHTPSAGGSLSELMVNESMAQAPMFRAATCIHGNVQYYTVWSCRMEPRQCTCRCA